jgi:LPS export ABC transporter protein LptC
MNRIGVSSMMILGCVLLISCTNSMEEVKEVADLKELPAKETYGVTYLRSVKGNLTNRLTSPFVKQFKDGDAEFPEGFVLEILDSSRMVTAHLEAQYGKLDNTNKTMLARDSVVFINMHNEALYTEELIWKQDSDRVFTDKFVKIRKKDVIILGKGLEANQDFTKYRIKSITGEYYIDEQELMNEDSSITSNTTET